MSTSSNHIFDIKDANEANFLIELQKLEDLIALLNRVEGNYYFIEKAVVYWYSVLLQQSSSRIKIEIYLRHIETYISKLKKNTKSFCTIAHYYRKTINVYDAMLNREKVKELSTEYLEYFQSIGQQNKHLVDAYLSYIKCHLIDAK